MEDKYDFDEEYDDAKDIKRKQLAKKAAVKEAKQYLEGLKSKYYEEIKSTSRLTPEQREAVEFFNRYKEENEAVMHEADKQKKAFQQKTEEVFSQDFNGFDFKVGEKAYKLNVKNLADVRSSQSDISNFVKKFLSEDNTMKDAKGYHKGLFAAMNPDLVAQHFYEQGKADAIKETMERSKNIDMNPRGVHEASTISNGWTVRAVNGQDVSRLKVKTNR
jgi:murein L,D-transpeptidase YcbB/YkuD